MANFYPAVQGFISGILSRRFWGRVLSDVYANALDKCHNWIITPQGSLKKRPGTEYIETYQGGSVALHTFNRDQGRDLIAVFRDNKLQLMGTDGNELDTVDLVRNGSFSDGKNSWETSKPAAIAPERLGSGSNFSYITQVINGVHGVGIGFWMQWASSSSFLTTNLKQTIGISNPLQSHKLMWSLDSSGTMGNNVDLVYFSVRVGTAPNLSDLVNRQYVVQGVGAGRKPNLNWLEDEFSNFVPGVATVYLHFDCVAIGPHVNTSMYVNLYNVKLLADSGAADVNITTPYTPDDLNNMQVAMDSALRELYVATPNHRPKVLRINTVTNVWEFVDIPFIQGASGGTPAAAYVPPKWSSGSWPRCVAIHQSRLWFANTSLAPAGVWASRTGKYLEMYPGSNAADPMAFELSSPVSINWLSPHKVMLMGTDNSEWILTAAGGVVKPADFQFKEQSYYGSVPVQPARTGLGIVYVSRTRETVRYIHDAGDAMYGWASSDIGMKALASSGKVIQQIVYGIEPYYLLYVLFTDGTMAVATFAYDMEIVAWSTYSLNGLIKSIAVTRDADASRVFMAVSRVTGQVDVEVTNPQTIYEMCLDSMKLITDPPVTLDDGRYLIGWDGTEEKFIPSLGMPDDQVWVIENRPGGETYIGGKLTKVFNDTVSQLSSTLMGTELVAAGSGAVLPAGAIIYAIAFSPDNRYVYAGGTFTTLYGVAANKVAVLDTDTGVWSALGTGVTGGDVLSLETATNGDLYVGGSFTLAGGVANTVRIAKWSGGAWSALGTGLNGVVRTIHVPSQVTDRIYAGGDFTNADGIANADYIASFKTGAWESLGAGTVNGAVYDVRENLLSGGETNIVLSGQFTNVGIPARGIASWNGSAFSAFGAGLRTTVENIAFYSTTTLFATARGESPDTDRYVFKWIPATAVWEKVNDVGINAEIKGLIVVGADDTFIICGLWTSIAGYSERYLLGLDHLSGQFVRGVNVYDATGGYTIIDDGEVNENFVTTPLTYCRNGGVYVPDDLAANIIIGVPFDSYMKTVPLEGGQQGGTSQTGKNRMPKLFVRILNSCMPKINGYTPTVDATLIPSSGNPEDAILSGDFTVSSEGYDLRSAVVIESDSPIRAEVSGVFSKAASEAV